MLPCESHLPSTCKTPALVTVQQAALWGPVLELPAGWAAYWLLADTTITGAYSGSGGSKHEGLHPPRKLAAKATWLWGLGGKQGREASPLDIDSSHLHGKACQRPSTPSPADTLSCNADLFGFKLYAEKPLGHFDLLPCSAPKKSRNKADRTTEPSHRCSG